MHRSYDLHSHSLCSDGTLTPTDLVAQAHLSGVDVLALTDHDVTDGIAEATVAANRLGLELVAGTEISVSWENRTIHILGLAIQLENAALQAGLARLRALREERGREIGQRLVGVDVIDAYSGAAALAKGTILSRTHFARYLVKAGHAKNVGRAFHKYLRRGRAGHVSTSWASLEEAVGWIRNAGGQAVIAHPARYLMGAGTLRRLLGEFRECGGEGLEVVSGSHGPEDTHRLGRFANALGLLASSGSDYHGPEYFWRELGGLPPIPVGCIPIWESWCGVQSRTGTVI